MKKRLYVSDLDGTLLNKSGDLSEFSKEGLSKLIDQGVMFTVATARSFVSIRRILKDLQIQVPIVEFNGAYVTDFQTGQHLLVNAIDHKVCRKLFDLFRSHGLGFLVSTYKEVDQLFYTEVTNAGLASYIKDREAELKQALKQVDNFEALMDYQVICLTLIGSQEDLSRLKEAIEGIQGIQVEFWEDMYYRPWYWLTVHSQQATKGQALKSLSEWVDFDELVVFGDNFNDLDMFQEADQAFAVANAVDELKRIADDVLEDHHTDSVVKKILAMEKGM